ncbi:MAG: single-stranded DNA-binding protein [Armatimonadota bacterium]
MSLNCVCLTGRLTRDPELRTTTTGKQVVSFTVAVQKRFKPQDDSQPDASFIDCVAWGQQAEFLGNYGTKGRMVGVTGRLEQRRYQAQDGTNRNVVEVVVYDIQLLDRPRDDPQRETASGQADGSMADDVLGGELEDYDPFDGE